MVDLFGADKGNISLPPRLQSPEVLDGKSDDLNQVMILNMQKAFYQMRITDILKRIQRLQSRNVELEEFCVAEKVLRSQTDVQTGDQIAQLNRQIFGEMEKITEHQKRIQAVKKWMEEEKQAHLDKVEEANKKYTKTHQEITFEIKVLNAKINTLEEYKVAKTDLRNKLIAGNNLIIQRDEEVKQRCEQIQRKFKIGREKLKKEMYARLQGLAGTFQMEVAASVAKPIHRLMRENVFVKNELIDIVRESIPKKEKMKQKKEADEEIINKTVTLKKSTVQYLIRSKIQRYLLAVVKEQHTRVKDCVEVLKNYENENKLKSIELIYGYAKIQAEKVLQYVSRLETDFHKQQTQLGFVNYLRDRSKTELQRCIDILYDAKYAVACALKMTNTGKDILEMGDTQLMSYLLEILRKAETQKWENKTPSLVTILQPEEAYKIGDLGYDVSHVELHRPRRSMEKKLSNPSTLNILAGLGIRLSGMSSARNRIEPWQMDVIDLVEESEDFFEQKAHKIIVHSSLSLDSQEKELDHQPAKPKIDEEKNPETDGKREIEAEGKIETEEKVPENEAAKQDEVDNDETMAEISADAGSEMFIIENNEEFLEENRIQE